MPSRTARTLAAIEAELETAWAGARRDHHRLPDDAVARLVLEEPDHHEWRVVDAALDRLSCEACGSRLGSGARGCPTCDLADGFRFAAREVDRPGVPPGNEHALRVSTAVLRAAGRYPAHVVHGNEVFLPLFAAGLMPTRSQRLSLIDAAKRGLPWGDAVDAARSFEELASAVTGGGEAGILRSPDRHRRRGR